jgi:autotransporter-associated beta strand protein
MKNTLPARLTYPACTAALLLAFASVADASTKIWNTTSGSLSATGSWSPTGAPTTTDEALFDGTVTPAVSISTAAAGTPSWGNLIWNNNTPSTFQMNTTSNNDSFIRLTGAGGFTAAIAAGGASGDLMVMGTSATSSVLSVSSVNINAAPGTASLRLRLDNSGNFNVVNSGATLNIQTIISENGGARTLTKTGAGQLTLGSPNTFTGGVVLSAGTLGVGSSTALGSGNLTINGGTLAAVTSPRTITNAITVGGNFTLGGLTQSITLNGATLNLGGATRTITLNNSATIGGVVSNGGLILENPSGTRNLTLNGNNTYLGATTVNSGTLILGGAGSINTTSAITVNGGTFKNNSSVNLTAPLTFTSGTVGGTNLSGVDLTIGTGQVLSPGNSPGTMTADDTTFATGGAFLFEMNNTGGAAGTNWDLLNSTSLTITAGLGGFTVNVASLVDPTNVAGLATGFDSAVSQNFLFVDTNSAITSFSASAFAVDTSLFQNTNTGTWTIARGDTIGGGDNTQLYVSYAAIPEPSAYALGAAFAVLGLAAIRRRRAAR